MVNFNAKLDKLKSKEEDIKKKKIELQKQLLKYLKWEKGLTNKQICNYVDIHCANFSKYYGGKLLFRDATLYKLIDMWESGNDE